MIKNQCRQDEEGLKFSQGRSLIGSLSTPLCLSTSKFAALSGSEQAGTEVGKVPALCCALCGRSNAQDPSFKVPTLCGLCVPVLCVDD